MPDDDPFDEHASNPAEDRVARASRWIGLFSGLMFLAFALYLALDPGGV